MCVIGLLLPLKQKEESRKQRCRHCSHRHSERSHRERAHRREEDETEASEHRNRQRSQRREIDETRDPERRHHERSRRREKDELTDHEHRHRERSRRRDRGETEYPDRSHRERRHQREGEIEDMDRRYREKSYRGEEDETKHSERRHRERPHRREKYEARDSASVAEEALARLCLTLEQSLLDEQRRWRYQDRLDMLERQRLGLDGEPTPFEAAPPYSLVAENPRRAPPEPQYQAGAADVPDSRKRGSVDSEACCRNCVCTHCGAVAMKCPAIPELDDTRVSPFAEVGAEPPRVRVGAAGGL